MGPIAAYVSRFLDGMDDKPRGHLVYRHWSDMENMSDEAAWAHRVAVFLSETEAVDYCAYRNEMFKQHGTDSVAAIKRSNVSSDS